VGPEYLGPLPMLRLAKMRARLMRSRQPLRLRGSTGEEGGSAGGKTDMHKAHEEW
jgi:hypothetical protein